jgi:hypothetical protein
MEGKNKSIIIKLKKKKLDEESKRIKMIKIKKQSV